MEEEIRAKRELGNGRWDRALKNRMVELSTADTYDEAKHEWIATGQVWWRTLGAQPSWVDRLNYCMCGHHIVYHFEIHNTQTDYRTAVGSDHINSYLIMRAIREETGLNDGEITEAMIQEWIDVRVESLKVTAWWNVHGDDFTEMFNEVKELDLRINVRQTRKNNYNRDTMRYEPVTAIRKVGSGKYGKPDYEMASIVWRWNHPDNPKAQANTRGYPNDKLWGDLVLFWTFVDEHQTRIDQEDSEVSNRLAELTEEQQRLERQRLLVRAARKEKEQNSFEESCLYLGFRVFDETDAWNDWERNFLRDMRSMFMRDKRLTENQTKSLTKIIKRNDKPITEAQSSYLVALGYEGEIPNTNRKISILIDEWKIKRGSEMNE